jgi:hypothetical protein
MKRYEFRTRWRNDADDWSENEPAITKDASLDAIRDELQRGPIIVEHWHYRGGAAPSRRVFEDWESFETFLKADPFAGDAIDVWSFTDLCTGDRRIANGKCPAADGKMPRGGSY